MLPAAARMRHREVFQRTVRTGRRGTRPSMTVHIAADASVPAATGPQVGFVVSRKVGPAVVRNRVRRRLRHITRDRLAVIADAVPGAAVVVRVAPRAASASGDQLARDFDAALADAVSRGRRQ